MLNEKTIYKFDKLLTLLSKEAKRVFDCHFVAKNGINTSIYSTLSSLFPNKYITITRGIIIIEKRSSFDYPLPLDNEGFRPTALKIFNTKENKRRIDCLFVGSNASNNLNSGLGYPRSPEYILDNFVIVQDQEQLLNIIEKGILTFY